MVHEVLLIEYEFTFPMAALAEVGWLVALCVVTRAWHRRGATKYSWLAAFRAALLATGGAPVYVGAVLYLRVDSHVAALVVLSGGGIAVLAELAQVRIRRAEERRALTDLARTHAT